MILPSLLWFWNQLDSSTDCTYVRLSGYTQSVMHHKIKLTQTFTRVVGHLTVIKV